MEDDSRDNSSRRRLRLQSQPQLLQHVDEGDVVGELTLRILKFSYVLVPSILLLFLIILGFDRVPGLGFISISFTSTLWLCPFLPTGSSLILSLFLTPSRVLSEGFLVNCVSHGNHVPATALSLVLVSLRLVSFLLGLTVLTLSDRVSGRVCPFVTSLSAFAHFVLLSFF